MLKYRVLPVKWKVIYLPVKIVVEFTLSAYIEWHIIEKECGTSNSSI